LVEERGFQHDRRWMLVDDDRQFITQREVPQMATVKLEVSDDGLVASRNGSSITVQFEPGTGDLATVTVWSAKVKGEFYPQEIHNWFTEAIGASCKLVHMPLTARRIVPPPSVRLFKDTVSFADAYPYLLISEGSLADLNSRLEQPVGMNRFRPNLVVSGAEPFEEDTWKRIRVGDVEFHLVKPCARCVMTTVDQAAGVKDGKEPLKTLSEYRNQDGKVLFGQNLIADTPGGTVRVGDRVEVLERKN
jgi:uncharacterized protein YcbX